MTNSPEESFAYDAYQKAIENGADDEAAHDAYDAAITESLNAE